MPTFLNSLLNRALNIRPNERPRVGLLILMLLLAVIGNIWGRSIVYGAVLDQVGLAALPQVTMGAALLSLLVTAVYTAFADRVANDRLLIAILLVNLLGIGIGRLLLGQGFNTIAFPLIYITFLVIGNDAFFLHWWTYVNGFYDTRSAKRIVPVVASAARFASILSGLTLASLNNYFNDPGRIIDLWFILLLVVTLLAASMPRLLKDTTTVKTAVEGQKRSNYLTGLRDGYAAIRQSNYLMWMLGFTLALMVLNPIVNYQTGEIFLRDLGSTTAISSYVASLIGITNLIMLPIQLLFGRFINRFGLGNANLVYPTATFLICSVLLFTENSSAAALAYLNLTVFYTTFRQPTDSLLYNAVPLNVKGRVRAFIAGIIVPIGTIIGSALVLLPLVSFTWFVPVLIVLFSLLYLLGAFQVRQQYTKALVSLLEQEDYASLLVQDAEEINVTDPTALNSLKKKLEESPSDEFTIFMARLISEVGGETAVPILAETTRQHPNPHVRATILDILLAADLRNDGLRQLYTDLLQDNSGLVRRSALAGLERLEGGANRQFLSLALTLLNDTDAEVRAESLPPLLCASDTTFQNPALQQVDKLLTSPQSGERVAGIHALRRTGDGSFALKVVNYLNDPADEVRLEAALAIEGFAAHKRFADRASLVISRVIPLLQDPIERVRQAALVTLGQQGSHDAHRAIATALSDASPTVRATAVNTLTQLGKATIPTVHALLDSPDTQLRKMAAVILSRINKREYAPLINTHITSNLLIIYSNLGRLEALTAVLHKQSSLGVLHRALQEQNQRLIAEIFYLLTAVHEANAIHIVHESLSDPSPHIHANAIEALESFTSPEIAHLIAPLLNPTAKTAELLQVGRSKWEMRHPNTRQTIEQLINDKQGDPWLRTIALYALGEMGLAATSPTPAKPDPDPKTAEPKPTEEDLTARRKRRRSAADLLNALSGEPADSPEPAPASPPAQPDVMATFFIASPSARLGFSPVQMLTLAQAALDDPHPEVRQAAQIAYGRINGQPVLKENAMLSIIERIIFLKEVLFFQNMTIDQLKVLANVCEEEFFPADTTVFNEGDTGGVMYVVVRGKVGVERSGRRKGSVVRLATVEAHAYFGEMNLFDNSPRSSSAVALQDTLTLRLRREPLIALARQYPDLSLELINVLSQSLRETTDRVAELTRTQPRELHKLFDQFES